MRLLVTFLFVALFCETFAKLPCLEPVKSSFKVYSLHDGAKECQIERKLRRALKRNGFSKVMCPFGILMVATKRYPNEVRSSVRA